MGRSKRRAKNRRLGLIGLALLAVLTFAVVGWALKASPTPEPSAATASPSAHPIKTVYVPQMLIIGDSFTGGSDMGGYKDAGWPALVQSGYVKNGARLQLNLLARGGAGYLTPGQVKETLGQSYSGNPYGNQDVVLVFAGLNDASQPPAAVGSAAASLYSDLRAKSPKAMLIVIGPAWPNPAPTPGVLAVRDAIRASAEAAGATFIDPIAEGWFTGDAAALIGKDKTHPTDEGHKYMAAKLAPVITTELTKRADANK
jgi:lysophospholipase L1-like esterase